MSSEPPARTLFGDQSGDVLSSGGNTNAPTTTTTSSSSSSQQLFPSEGTIQNLFTGDGLAEAVAASSNGDFRSLWTPAGFDALPKPNRGNIKRRDLNDDYVGLYRSNIPKRPYLVTAREHLPTKKQREDAIKQAIAEKYGVAPNSKELNDIFEQVKKDYATEMARERALKPRTKKARTLEEMALREIHERKPNVMVQPLYNDILKKMRGVDTHENLANQDWLGYTPQTLLKSDPKRYNKMAKDFAEMVGVLQMRPKMDRRLLTIPSAKEVFGRNANKYEFSYEDMDNDPNTPATLLITKKAEMDEKGNVIPARLIAAGGYRIPFATAKQTEALMKDQHYYMKNPTSKQRKETKRDAFLYEKSKFADVYNKARPVRNTGLKLVVNFIKAALKNFFGVEEPKKSGVPFLVNVGGEVVDSLGLGTTKVDQAFVYDLSPIAFNSYVKHMAELFTYYYLFPALVNIPPKADESEGYKALRALYNGRGVVHKWAKAGDIPMDINPNNRLVYWMMNAWRKDCYFHPRLETAILACPDVQKAIAYALNVIDNAGPDDKNAIPILGLQTGLVAISRAVLAVMMNNNLGFLAKMFGVSDLNAFMLAVATNKIIMTPIPTQDVQDVLGRIATGALISLPITPLSNAKLPITLRATPQYIDPSLLTGANPWLPQSAAHDPYFAAEDDVFGEDY